MTRHFSADYVFTLTGPPLERGVISVNDDGVVTGVWDARDASLADLGEVIRYPGLLVPGFINCHCHLELSSLKNAISKHTGLVEFIKQVMALRPSSDNGAIVRADQEMFDNGIVAVGDISNSAITADVKKTSFLKYFTFIEVMGFNPDLADQALARAIETKARFGDSPCSIVPHSPYSVSAALFDRLKMYAEQHPGSRMSMHNQETAEEDHFFKAKQGNFIGLYEYLGLDISFFEAYGRSSIQSVLHQLPVHENVLLVHNTFTSSSDVEYIKGWSDKVFFCVCPGANLYIEGKLPDVAMLRSSKLKITIGTDSLASNDSLSILAEIQILQGHFDIPVQELLTWACLNGAEFLGMGDKYGSFEPGKQPGMNVVDFTVEHGQIRIGTNIKRVL